MQQQLASHQAQHAGAGAGGFRLGQEQADGHQCAGAGGRAQQGNIAVHAFRQRPSGGGPGQAEHRRGQQGVAHQRAAHLKQRDADVGRLLPVEFDQGDGNAEQDAGGQQRGERGGRQAFRAKQRHAQRDAHVARVGIGRRQAFDAAVGEWAPSPPAGQERHQEGDGDAAREGGHKAPVRHMRQIHLRHGAKQQRRQGQVDHVAVQGVGGAGPQHPPPGGQPACQDQRKDRQGGGDDGIHGWQG
ncbi:hypothetical protein D3C71_1476600 [compost metagenome]